MTQRTHFWLRIVGLGVILTLQFGPRLWTHAAAAAASAPVAAALVAR